MLDPGTVEFEKALPGSAKNSDLYGEYHGAPLRIEVTVLHDEQRPSIDVAWNEEIESAEIPSGYRVVLKNPVSSMEAAKRIRMTVERIHSQHQADSEQDVKIDETVFRWDRGVYRPDDHEKFIDSVSFDQHPDVRQVVNPCSTRRVTPKFIEDEFPNPPDVCSVTPEGPHHNDNTLSGKVLQTVEGKLGQMERGTMNIRPKNPNTSAPLVSIRGVSHRLKYATIP